MANTIRGEIYRYCKNKGGDIPKYTSLTTKGWLEFAIKLFGENALPEPITAIKNDVLAGKVGKGASQRKASATYYSNHKTTVNERRRARYRRQQQGIDELNF